MLFVPRAGRGLDSGDQNVIVTADLTWAAMPLRTRNNAQTQLGAGFCNVPDLRFEAADATESVRCLLEQMVRVRGCVMEGGGAPLHDRQGMNSLAESPKSPLKGTPILCPESASADFDRLSRGISFPGNPCTLKPPSPNLRRR